MNVCEIAKIVVVVVVFCSSSAEGNMHLQNC